MKENKQMKEKKENLRGSTIIFSILFLCAFVLCLWRCKYGFAGDDEPFYYALTHRLVQGDALFKDEWHLSQLSAVLLLPFTYLYETLTGSTEGILYAGRITYTVIHGITAIFLYSKLRKHGPMTMLGVLSFFIFAPLEINCYFYNTMALDGIALSGVIMAEAKEQPVKCISAGILYSISVLCCPYLAILFLAMWLFMGIRKVFHRKENGPVTWRETALFSVGVVIAAVLFLIVLFSRTSIRDIVINLPLMLQDSEHQKVPLLFYLQRMLYYYTQLSYVPEYFAHSLLLVLILSGITILDKNRKRRSLLYFIVSFSVAIWTLIMFRKDLNGSFCNMLMLPMAYMGFTSYMMAGERLKRYFWYLFFPGLVHAVVLQFSSNQYFFVLAMAGANCALAGSVFSSAYLYEEQSRGEKWGKRIEAVLLYAVALTVLSLQVYVKCNHCYWEEESPLTGLEYRLEEGPAKDLYTSKENADKYNRLLADLRPIKQEKGNLLVYDNRTWPYLYLEDMRCGSHSAWLSRRGHVSGIDHLLSYYQINEEKKPDWIFVIKDPDDDLEKHIAKLEDEYGYHVQESELSYIISKNR